MDFQTIILGIASFALIFGSAVILKLLYEVNKHNKLGKA